MAYATVNGARLFYEVAGDGPTIVFVHHGIADARVWDPQWNDFAEAHRVLRYDLRGFGRSSLPGGEYSHVDDLRALLQLVGIERGALIAASMGSRVALELALTAPELVSALAIAPPGGYGAEESEEIRRYDDAEDDALERGDVEAAIGLNVAFWAAGPGRELGDVDADVLERVAEMQRRAFQVQLPAVAGDDQPRPRPAFPGTVADRLGEVRIPTLVVVGEEDASVIRETADRLAANVPGARLEVLRDTAHVPNLERPDEFNRVVLGFLEPVLGAELAH